MIKKLGLFGVVFLSVGLYGMDKEKVGEMIARDPGAYLHSVVAHDYSSRIAAHNKYYFRGLKVQFIETIQSGTGVFSQILAPQLADEETQRYVKDVKRKQELRRDAQEDARRRALERSRWEQKQREKEKALREQFLQPSAIFTPSVHILQSR